MVVKIRLARFGAKKKPYYRVVVANSDAPRDGRSLEQVGAYNPMLSKEDEGRVILDQERIKYWLSVGAQPTERVNKFLEKAKIIKARSVKRVIKTKIAANEVAKDKVKVDKSSTNQSVDKIVKEDKTTTNKPAKEEVKESKPPTDKPSEEKVKEDKEKTIVNKPSKPSKEKAEESKAIINKPIADQEVKEKESTKK